jgi:hypothetical protein
MRPRVRSADDESDDQDLSASVHRSVLDGSRIGLIEALILVMNGHLLKGIWKLIKNIMIEYDSFYWFHKIIARRNLRYFM